MLEQNQDEIGAQIQYRLIEQLSEAETLGNVVKLMPEVSLL